MLSSRQTSNRPKVSIFWLNYNSLDFIDLALESLRGIGGLDYHNYELIIVDNASSDGSFQRIRDYVKELGLNVKLICLKKNLGFTGGNNIAYIAMDWTSNYIVLLNNDVAPYPDSLSRLVEERDKSLGAAQGIILTYNGEEIDTAGDFVDELLRTYPLLRGQPRAL